jgi:hypothetical protein
VPRAAVSGALEGVPSTTVQPMSQRRHGWRRSSGVFRGEVTRALAAWTGAVVAQRRVQWMRVTGAKGQAMKVPERGVRVS